MGKMRLPFIDSDIEVPFKAGLTVNEMKWMDKFLTFIVLSSPIV